MLHREPSPEEILMQKISMQQLYEALDHLPPIQARRVYAHYILGMKKVDIARAEGVTGSVVCNSVRKGVKNLRRYFEKKKWME
jgi:RNA polymerase sigma-70 factor (ECF subfamily)